MNEVRPIATWAKTGLSAELLGLLPAGVTAKEVLGAGVVAAVLLVAATSLRLYAQGPDWGLQLASGVDGGVVAQTVRGHGVAWEQHIRPGDRVVSVEGVDAHAFIGQRVGPVTEVAITDAYGNTQTVRPPELSETLRLWLPGVAVLFALLGVVVYRWSLDASLARIFLIFAGTTALALSSMPAAQRGYAPTHFLAASSAIVASAAFTTVFLWFPRPVRAAQWLTNALAALTACLVIPLVALYWRGEGTPPILETILFAWMGGNLYAGTLLLGWRAILPAYRYMLAPLALGIGVGIFPLAFLDALPQALGHAPIMWADSAATSVAAIPLAFAYTILRHRLFALDAHVRRFVFRVCGALALVALFVPTWLILRSIGIDDQIATLLGVLIVALAAPTVWRRTEGVLESWFYPSLGLARTRLLANDTASASLIAQALVARSREYVPTRWVVLMVHERARAREGPAWELLASDGEVPSAWPPADQLVSLVALAQDVPDMTMVRMDRLPSLSAAVCVGPRLDGTPPGGVDMETIRLLAARVLPLLEAALLRERTRAQARFRQGLWELARELAAVGPESDVLRVTAEHAARLVDAEHATVLRRLTADGQAYVPVDAMPDVGSPEQLESVIQLDLAARDRSGYVSYVNAPGRPSMLVSWLGASQPSEALLVLARRTPFNDEDARRAVEIAAHAAGALRRAHLSAEAAEERARHEVDRLRKELLTSAMLRKRGHLEVRVSTVDLSAAVTTIARTFQVLPGGERILVDVTQGVCTRADPDRLHDMIGNLLLDALLDSPGGPIVLRARVANPIEVYMEVCDRTPASATASHASDLSVAMVRSLAELHGGRVARLTTPDGGSTVRIVLPRADSAPSRLFHGVR